MGRLESTQVSNKSGQPTCQFWQWSQRLLRVLAASGQLWGPDVHLAAPCARRIGGELLGKACAPLN